VPRQNTVGCIKLSAKALNSKPKEQTDQEYQEKIKKLNQGHQENSSEATGSQTIIQVSTTKDSTIKKKSSSKFARSHQDSTTKDFLKFSIQSKLRFRIYIPISC
jgi:hypothetical protein